MLRLSAIRNLLVNWPLFARRRQAPRL